MNTLGTHIEKVVRWSVDNMIKKAGWKTDLFGRHGVVGEEDDDDHADEHCDAANHLV